MDLYEVTKTLCTAVGVAGEENSTSQTALELLKEYAEEAYIDDFNNVIGVIRKPKEGEKTVLLDAHIDEIGMIVTHIDENGFLKAANCGGVDRRLLLAQQVLVHGENTLTGIVATLPPHLTGGDEKKVPEMEEILIDIGMSREDAERVVSPGDRITISSQFRRLAGSRVSSKSLDDRCCAATILLALSSLEKEALNCGLTVVFSAQEETGERGAEVAGFAVNPDVAIALDVSFAHTPDASVYKCGKMGKGPMIGVAPTLTKQISNRLIELAKAEDIPYQLEVMGGSTGTNADVLGTVRGGAKTGLLSIPQKYMHTPIEVVDLQDMEQAAKLLSAYLMSFGKEEN